MKLIIFDFDGTIADTFEFVPEIVAKLAPEFGRKTPTREELEELKSKSAREIVKKYKISIFELPKVLVRAREEIAARMTEVRTFTGLPAVIQRLNKDYELAIISSNSESNIRTFLEKNNIKINRVISEKSLFGKAKIIKGVLKELQVNKNEAIYVGDEVRDVESANEAGIKAISVTWGHNSKLVLGKVNKILADKPEDIIKLVEEMS